MIRKLPMPRPSQPCASVLTLAVAAVAASPAAATLRYGPWDPASPVSINTPANEGCPIESPDGRSLYIASNRPGTYGNLDIWRSFRGSTRQPWSTPENLGPVVNSADFDYCPTPIQGNWLLYVTSKDTETDDDPLNDDCLPGPPATPPPGNPAGGDMFLTREKSDGSWVRPLHLGCYPDGPNTAGAEFSPSLVFTWRGVELYFSSNGYPDSQQQDIYVSRVLWDGTITPGQRIAALSTEFDDRMPNVRRDGLEMVFSSNRPGGAGGQDVYVSTRRTVFHPWGAPQRIDNPTINTSGSETRASLSGDGTRLHFGRDGDIFVAERRKLRPF